MSPIVSDAVGLVASVLLAIPWYREFLLRRRRDRHDEYEKRTEGALRRRVEKSKTRLTQRLEKASSLDLTLTTLGMTLLAISFGIKLLG